MRMLYRTILHKNDLPPCYPPSALPFLFMETAATEPALGDVASYWSRARARRWNLLSMRMGPLFGVPKQTPFKNR